MRKSFKKIMSSVLVAALAFTMAVPVQVSAAEELNYDKKKVAYMPAKTLGDRYEDIWLYINGMGEKDRVTQITTSDKKVAVFDQAQFSTNLYETSSDGKNYKKEDWGSCSTSIGIKPLKAGSTKVDFKIGSKSHSIDLNVLAYENPVDSMKISGVNGDKELKSLTDKQIWAEGVKVTKNVAAGKITAKAKSGWKISSIQISGNDSYYYMSDYKHSSSKVTFNVGKIEKGKYYDINVTYINSKTGGEIRCNYNIQSQ